MRVFVTGASGWIGSALVPQLIDAGHEVVGLARSDESAAALSAAGVEAVRGSLDELDTLRAVADKTDGVVHLAFKHDEAFSGNFPAATAADRAAVEAFGDVLAGSGRPLLIAAGTLGLLSGDVLTEDVRRPSGDPANLGPAHRRIATAEHTLALAERGVRSGVVRLPPTVHGVGDAGFVPALITIARERGVSGYVGDGTNRWPAVHRTDAARLFGAALEHAPAGAVLHAVADEGVSLGTIAEIIGRHLDVPVVSIAADEAPNHFGWLAGFVASDSPASSARTQALLGWHPNGPGLIEDLEKGHYFRP